MCKKRFVLTFIYLTCEKFESRNGHLDACGRKIIEFDWAVIYVIYLNTLSNLAINQSIDCLWFLDALYTFRRNNKRNCHFPFKIHFADSQRSWWHVEICIKFGNSIWYITMKRWFIRNILYFLLDCVLEDFFVSIQYYLTIYLRSCRV